MKILENKCFIFDFNPWHFDGESDLLQKFLTEFKDTINEKYYLPDLWNSFDSFFSRLWDTGIDFYGIKLTLNKPNKTLKKIKEDIDSSLQKIPKKIIVIMYYCIN